ncbi:MAG: hypothetical protein KatS3mg126_0572 [Lysobacteraceae bacterium]|nr:MAG: hypothetical protein KatS3mg126_0572 [Xanthomonadaceae bacterium]
MEHGTIKGRILTEATTRVHTPSLAAEAHPWCLKLVSGPDAGAVFALGDSALVGREHGVDVRLAETSVSRRHCHLYRKRGGYWVLDLGATNPTRVNGMQVTATPMMDGDLLHCGDLDLKLIGPRNPEHPRITLPPAPDGRDRLSGVLCRSRFREALEGECARRQGDGALALLVLDVDHFRHINDRFGFAAGDRALKTLGRLLLDQCRDGAQPGRIGGEEFAVLLPGCPRQEAMRLAERLRQSIAALELLEDGEPVTFTASIGVAALRSSDTGCDPLYGRADAALYEAKRLGRNRVVAFPDG